MGWKNFWSQNDFIPKFAGLIFLGWVLQQELLIRSQTFHFKWSFDFHLYHAIKPFSVLYIPENHNLDWTSRDCGLGWGLIENYFLTLPKQTEIFWFGCIAQSYLGGKTLSEPSILFISNSNLALLIVNCLQLQCCLKKI